MDSDIEGCFKNNKLCDGIGGEGEKPRESSEKGRDGRREVELIGEKVSGTGRCRRSNGDCELNYSPVL